MNFLSVAIMARVAERLRATNSKVKTLTALNLSLQDELAALRAGAPAVDLDIDRRLMLLGRT